MFPPTPTWRRQRARRSTSCRRPCPPSRPRIRAFEPLEDRRLLAIDFAQFGDAVQGALVATQTTLNTALDTASQVPFLNQQLDNLTETKFVKEAGDKIKTALAPLVNPTKLQVQQAIDNVLGNLLGDTNGNGTPGETEDVVIPTFNSSTVTVQLLLHRDVAGLNAPITFGIGLPGVPLDFRTQGGVQLDLGMQYMLGFTFTSANALTLNQLDLPGHTYEMAISAQASLANFNAQATIGFLDAKVTDSGDNSSSDPLAHTELNLTFAVDNLASGSPTVSLDGVANVNLAVEAGAGVNFPSLGTNLFLHWGFGSSNPANESPDVVLKGVHVSLGSTLSQMVKPLVDVVQAVSEPLGPIIDVLKTKIPGLSELWDLFQDPDSGVSLLDLVKIVSPSLPEGYNELVTLAVFLVDVTDLIQDISGTADNLQIDFHDFDLGQIAGGKDLRSLSPLAGSATDLDFVGSLQPDFQLAGFSNGFNFSEVETAIQNSGIPSQLQQPLIDTLNKLDDGITYSFPLIDNPAMGAVSLLLGNDVDLFNLTADFDMHAKVPSNLPTITLPFGLEASVSGEIVIHAHFEAAYDTHGIRSFLKELVVNNNTDFGLIVDGFYLSSDTVFDAAGKIAAVASGDWGLAEAGVEGGLEGAFHVGINQDPAIIDGGKVYLYSELGPCLFEISGNLDAGIYAFLEVGAGPVTYRKEWEIVGGPLFSFGSSCIPNPFIVEYPIRLAGLDPALNLVTPVDPNAAKIKDFNLTPAANGILTLNMGPNAQWRNPNSVDNSDGPEAFVISAGQADDVVIVSAFGFSERYFGVQKIFADGGVESDQIQVGEGVTVEIELHGGSGDDNLTTAGSGPTYLYGDGENDILLAGVGPAMLSGGPGNDHLDAGTATALLPGSTFSYELYGGPGNDVLNGGTGPNALYGQDDDDKLTAGPSGDYLQGGGGNDVIATGLGDDTAIGDRGNDTITWNAGNGSPTIDGGSGIDTVSLLGSSGADLFEVSTAPAASGWEVVVAVDIGGAVPPEELLFSHVENLDLQGMLGADTSTIHEVTASSLNDISVNTGDLDLPDNVLDHVSVEGTPVADFVNVSQETVVVKPAPPPGVPILGGLTRVFLSPYYFVHAANVQDDLKIHTFGGDDTVFVFSFTGPTDILTYDGDDRLTLQPAKPDDFLAVLDLEAGEGKNRFEVDESASLLAGGLVLTTDHVSGALMPLGVNFVATGGDYKAGVSVTTTPQADNVSVRSTLQGVTTSVFTRGSNDTVTVSSDGTLQGHLATIQGDLRIDAGAGPLNVLRLVDFAATSGNGNVTVAPTQITGMAGPADGTVIRYAALGGKLSLWLEGSNNTALAEGFRVDNPIANLTLNGNAGDDTIEVLSLSSLAMINAGAGADVVRVGNSLGTLDSIQGPLFINGESGTDAAYFQDWGTNSGKTYLVSTAAINRSGIPMIGYNGVETLTVRSGAFDDQFTVSGVKPGTTASLVAGGGTDSLVGPNNTSNLWKILGPGEGRINLDVLFFSFEDVTGGNKIDEFAMANGVNFLGKLKGGAGTDTLDYRAYTTGVRVNLLTSAASGVVQGVFDFENIVGSPKDDLLVGDNLDNVIFGNYGNDILVGNAGKDQLFGQQGRDLLIGGTGADTLAGGDDDDILINGTTAYDANGPALLALMAEWTRTDLDYYSRIANLRNGGGLNDPFRLNSTTVFVDGDADQLLGGGKLDWFWVDLADITDAVVALEKVN